MNKNIGKIFILWKVTKPEFLIFEMDRFVKEYKVDVKIEDIGTFNLNIHSKYANLRFIIKFYPTILFVTNEGLSKLENNINLNNDDISIFGSNLINGYMVKLNNNSLTHLTTKNICSDEVLVYEGLVAQSDYPFKIAGENELIDWFKELHLIKEKL